MNSTKLLTFQEFIDQCVETWSIPPELVFVSRGWDNFGKHGWHFRDDRNNCDYGLSWRMPSERGNVVGGGELRYSHKNGYSIDCKGLATELTWEEARRLFTKSIESKGTYIGSFKAKARPSHS